MTVVVQYKPIGDEASRFDQVVSEAPAVGDTLLILDAPAGFPQAVNWVVKGRTWQVHLGPLHARPQPEVILYIERQT